MKKSPVYKIFFGICAILVAWIFISKPDENNENSSASDEKEAVAALFGGGSGEDGPSRRSANNGNDSFFSDPDFMNTGVDGNVDEEKNDTVTNKNTAEPDILEPVNPNNPKNPQTGQPYTDGAMKKFSVLRKKFPGNDLIPSLKSEDQKFEQRERRTRKYALQSLVVQNNASTEEINEYYDLKKKSYSDRKELLGYVFESMAEKMSDAVKLQYTKVQKMNEQQLKTLAAERKSSLESAK